MPLSLVELWSSMGWFAKGIVFVLLLMSLLVATIAIRKLIDLYRIRVATLRFSPPFSDALAREDFRAAQNLIDTHHRSHLAMAFRRVFTTLTYHSHDRSLSTADIAAVQRLIDLNGLELFAWYRRGLRVLATIGATAPLVGLLGTTMGAVNAFSAMAAEGGDIAAVSAGIAQALVATALGLVVALPAVWFHSYFVDRIESLSMEITYTTKEFIGFLADHVAHRQRSAGSTVLELEQARGRTALGSEEMLS